MSLRQTTTKMIAEKLPQKRSTVSNGLRKRPQFEQIVNYIANGQETIMFRTVKRSKLEITRS
jgi:hypothetical protein